MDSDTAEPLPVVFSAGEPERICQVSSEMYVFSNVDDLICAEQY